MISTRNLRGHAPVIGVLCGVLVAALQVGCGDLDSSAADDEDPFEAALALAGSGPSCSGTGSLAPLRCARVPSAVSGDILDRAAAIRLGKALFWDTQIGGDGQVACATCHFHGGADPRTINSVNPGLDGVFGTPDDLIGSQGVSRQLFVALSPISMNGADVCAPEPGGAFGASRQVTGRNAPSVIGAVFNRDNFWDGRGDHRFNGLDPFGATGNAASQAISLDQASLASQAVGPPGSGVEMSCAGRAFNGVNSLGDKLLLRAALQLQVVSPTDSVLGAASAAPANGLLCGNRPCTYGALIAAAFQPALAADAQNQFSRIFGQAVQAYEATLIPDQTPLDRYLGGNPSALTSAQVKGLGLFTSGKTGCTRCHAGPELSDATLGAYQNLGALNGDGGDQGFHNLGVRPTSEDPGRAGTGPLGVSFSVSQAPADRGAFKTAQLRNVKLTGPYFHVGDKATLGDVVDFYARGGDFANPEKAHRIQPFSLQRDDRAALVDSLTNGLTDCRVENEAGPFDHPSLVVPNGPSLPAVGSGGIAPCY